jgi:tetratricopeptide (TPR) repeat protein
VLSQAARRAERLLNQKRIDEACIAFDKVVAQEPANGQVHRLYGLALRDAGQLDAALQHLKTAVVLTRDPVSMGDLADTLTRAGNLDDAEMCLDALFAQDPENPVTWRRLAAISAARNDDHTAAAQLREALARAPEDAHTLTLFGLIGLRLRYVEAARAAFLKARAFVRDEAYPLTTLADAMGLAEMYEEAVPLYDKALALEPKSVPVLCNKAGVLLSMGRRQDALESLRKAEALAPNAVPVLQMMVAVWRNLGDLQRAEQYSARALALDPAHRTARANAATLMMERGRFEEALEAIRALLRDHPGDAEIERFEALTLLLLGHLQEGFQKNESRLRLGLRGRALDAGAKILAPRWEGQDLAGKKILLTAEEGFGDTIHFVRYASLLAARGAEVGVRVQPALVRLAGYFSDVRHVHREGDEPPGYDYELPMLSLPHVFRTGLDSIPGNTPYLQMPEASTDLWRRRLDASRRLRVGLVWSGNPKHRNDHNRSIPWALIKPLTDVPDVAYYSLQVGPARADMLQDAHGVEDLVAHVVDYFDTACAASALDLVISVDTSVAHLAGALGKPVWTLLPLSPDWRWLLDRSDTPWYPGMRLFRQTEVRGWPAVIAKVAEALAQSRLGLSKPPSGALT